MSTARRRFFQESDLDRCLDSSHYKGLKSLMLADFQPARGLTAAQIQADFVILLAKSVEIFYLN